jgi:hypothetical protein
VSLSDVEPFSGDEEAEKGLLSSQPQSEDTQQTAIATDEADLDEAIKGLKLVEKTRPKLSGAGRKRFRKALEAGCTREEALIKAMTPATQNTPVRTETRRKRSNLECRSSFDQKETKKVKIREDLTQKGSATYAEAVGTIQLGLQPIGFPEITLKASDVALIEDAILKVVMEDKDKDIAPAFRPSEFRPEGLMVVKCLDQDTEDWLKTNFHRVKLPGDLKVKILTQKEIPSPFTF